MVFQSAEFTSPSHKSIHNNRSIDRSTGGRGGDREAQHRAEGAGPGQGDFLINLYVYVCGKYICIMYI
jgi:hypothetical protein